MLPISDIARLFYSTKIRKKINEYFLEVSLKQTKTKQNKTKQKNLVTVTIFRRLLFLIL